MIRFPLTLIEIEDNKIEMKIRMGKLTKTKFKIWNECFNYFINLIKENFFLKFIYVYILKKIFKKEKFKLKLIYLKIFHFIKNNIHHFIKF